MEADPLQLVPFCSALLTVGATTVVEGGPFGTLLVGEISSSRWEGERFRASQRGVAAADWCRLSTDGTLGDVDVRVTLETDDGALVFVAYNGRTDMRTGRVYSTPRFETGDERYLRLNQMVVVARGRFDPEAMTVAYAMYELR
jgi:hypothetical protein